MSDPTNPSIELTSGTKPSRARRATSCGSVTPSWMRVLAYMPLPSSAGRKGLVTVREAACHCGQLRLEVTGEPFAVSICNCLACQRRTGSAFGMQAGFRPDQVKVAGRYNDYSRISDEADRKEHVFHFCPECGSQVFYTEPDGAGLHRRLGRLLRRPGLPAADRVGLRLAPASLGRATGHGRARRPSGTTCGRSTTPASTPQAAERGRELLQTYPGNPRLLYNVACCESLTGQTADAIEHLRLAIEGYDPLRTLAADDSDFDPIRGEREFEKLVS